MLLMVLLTLIQIIAVVAHVLVVNKTVIGVTALPRIGIHVPQLIGVIVHQPIGAIAHQLIGVIVHRLIGATVPIPLTHAKEKQSPIGAVIAILAIIHAKVVSGGN